MHLDFHRTFTQLHRCTLRQSYECLGQQQFLPKVIILPASSRHAAAASAPGQQLLDWSFEEEQQLYEQAAASNQQTKQHRGFQSDGQQQRRLQQCAVRPPGESHTKQQTQRPVRRDSSQSADYSASATDGNTGLPTGVALAQQQNRRPAGQQTMVAANTEQPRDNRRMQHSSAADHYAESQQRVRDLLVSADINDPLAAADAIPNTVNDLVTALQLLATAPKPSTMMAIKQYESARQQLTAAVVHKFKKLLLGQQQKQKQGCEEGSRLSAAISRSQPKAHGQLEAKTADATSLAAALAELPPTKVAAATFSLGVLRHYDAELVPALEQASGQIMQDMRAAAAAVQQSRHVPQHNLIPSNGRAVHQATHTQRPHIQRQQQGQASALTVSGFNANQLGQIGQGFVYLDHTLSHQWQTLYLDTCRQQLRFMKAQQLASLAEFLLKYRYNSSSSNIQARCGSDCLSGGWVADYLTAAAAQVDHMRPSQLVPVLQAVASIYSDWQQQQQQQQQGQQVELLTAFKDLPMRMPSAAAAATTGYSSRGRLPGGTTSTSYNRDGKDGRTAGGSARSNSRHCLLPLLQAFQVQLPDMKMNHLAAVLPALAAVTRTPWSMDALRPLLLQVRLLLPAAAGPEAVAVAAAGVQLGAAADARDDQDWYDAYLHRLHALMRTLGPGDIAAAITTLAALRVRPYRAWVYELCARLRVEVRNMSSHEVVTTLEGLAVMRIRLDPEVLHLFVLGIRRWLGFMAPEDLTRLVRALSDMYRRPNGRTVLPGRTVQELVEEMERRIRLCTLQQGLPL